METLNQIFASLDIVQILINAFPSIAEPLIHGLESVFVQLFLSMKGVIKENPGLVTGSVSIALICLLVNSFKRLRKKEIPVR